MKSLLSTVLLSTAMLVILPGCKTTQADSACKCDPCTCPSPCTCGKTTNLDMNDDDTAFHVAKVNSND